MNGRWGGEGRGWVEEKEGEERKGEDGRWEGEGRWERRVWEVGKGREGMGAEKGKGNEIMWGEERRRGGRKPGWNSWHRSVVRTNSFLTDRLCFTA